MQQQCNRRLDQGHGPAGASRMGSRQGKGQGGSCRRKKTEATFLSRVKPGAGTKGGTKPSLMRGSCGKLLCRQVEEGSPRLTDRESPAQREGE
ncbi:hypothetical protein Cadr_000028592 [Camelus dromedarius]|uniref:Uncharacterized protein n=1 Tax=Camelus dromedarius TaxID=9838 RepID=A0A5N4CHS9_CAMDR|nr:hypothetical protein Cadr_000028592 [Camelus dromedarius]